MRILVRLPNWLGDAAMASGALCSLYMCFRNAEFYVVGSSVACAVCENFPNTHRITDTTKASKNRLLALYQLARSIPRADLAFSFQNTFLSALLLYLNGASERVGYARGGRGFLLTKAMKPLETHQFKQYLALIRPFCKEVLEYPYLPFAKVPLPSGRWIGINTGGAYGSAKRWNLDYFIQVIDFLLQEKYRVVLFGSSREAEANAYIYQSLLEREWCEESLLNLTQKTDIPTLAGYLQSLELLVSNDSGIMHLAAAFRVKTLALFGPTDPSETSPINPNARVISLHLPCSPCKKRICPLGHHRCMEDLKPSLVIHALQEMLAR